MLFGRFAIHFFCQPEFVFITGITDLGGIIHPSVKTMFIIRRRKKVSPIVTHSHKPDIRAGRSGFVLFDSRIDHIVPHIKRTAEFVVFGEGMSQFCIEVIEIIARRCNLFSIALFRGDNRCNRSNEKIVQRSTRRDIECSLSFDGLFVAVFAPFVFCPVKGSFDTQLSRNQSDGKVAMVAIGISVFLSYVNDRRKSSAIARREIAFV